MVARNIPGEETVRLRSMVDAQVSMGVQAMNTERVQELVNESGVCHLRYPQRVITETLKHKYGWCYEAIGSKLYLYYDPRIHPLRLNQCRNSARKTLAREMKALAKLAVKRNAALVMAKREQTARANLKAELIARATSNRTPFDEYIFRAAQKCGLVRGYCWPQ